ncbi:hypothetical protein KGF56_000822 [Candida oxycetoniae]|uniref:Small ribosomal subunit protein bS18m n=1 Tax=Candida oxycetoniae TaxID=497107 RepID=A0AAI9WZF1_9ASCO|nr:uncharacterized protein KGF56_000822 [Candida oxycetoniae]KAI3406341.1 hypothetical protein KGF56_000822 [Candida oxycetoniae]
MTVISRVLRGRIHFTRSLFTQSPKNNNVDASKIKQLKSKENWGASEANNSDKQAKSSVQTNITANLSEMTKTLTSGEPPVYIANSLSRRFLVGSKYNPFDFSLNRVRMERKAFQLRKVQVEDPFAKSGINAKNLYLMPEILSRFLTSTGQILPRDKTGCSAENQKKLTAAIRTARNLGLLSSKHRHYRPNLMGRFFSTSRVVLMDGQNIGRDSFSEKEKAQENVWIKKHEEDQLKRLKAQLEKQKDTIAKLEEEIKTTNNNKSK